MLTPNLPRGGKAWCGDVRKQAGRKSAQAAHCWKRQRVQPQREARRLPGWSWWVLPHWHPDLAKLEQHRMRVEGFSDDGDES